MGRKIHCSHSWGNRVSTAKGSWLTRACEEGGVACHNCAARNLTSNSSSNFTNTALNCIIRPVYFYDDLEKVP
ncbi:Uncharacterised protein [Vibrio cholerae]|nr:Uncharacterised protein [Vibrio cholerae]